MEKFHAHLDVCRRCSDRPFDLCPTGAQLLTSVVTEPEHNPAAFFASIVSREAAQQLLGKFHTAACCVHLQDPGATCICRDWSRE